MKFLRIFVGISLPLLLLGACSGMAEGNAEAPGGPALAVTAAFSQEDGAALRGGTVRLSADAETRDYALDGSGAPELLELPREGELVLTVLDSQSVTLGSMTLSLGRGAVIDAITDEEGIGRITLREDTEEISLCFVLTGNGAMRCALSLAEPDAS